MSECIQVPFCNLAFISKQEEEMNIYTLGCTYTRDVLCTTHYIPTLGSVPTWAILSSLIDPWGCSRRCTPKETIVYFSTGTLRNYNVFNTRCISQQKWKDGSFLCISVHWSSEMLTISVARPPQPICSKKVFWAQQGVDCLTPLLVFLSPKPLSLCKPQSTQQDPVDHSRGGGPQ